MAQTDTTAGASPAPSHNPNRLLTEKEVEAEYGINHRTLQAWRVRRSDGILPWCVAIMSPWCADNINQSR